MTCDEARRLAAIDVFGSLDSPDREALDQHLGTCAACARAVTKSTRLRDALALPEDLPEPDWERSWDIIAGKAWTAPAAASRHAAAWRWGAIAASLITAFALGLVAGRSLPGRATSDRNASASDRTPHAAGVNARRATTDVTAEPSIQEYAEALDPILVEFLQQAGTQSAPDATGRQRRALQLIARRTRALRTIAAQAGAPDLETLFAELEPLLVSMANTAPGDRESVEWLKSVIGERRIRDRVRKLAIAGSVL